MYNVYREDIRTANIIAGDNTGVTCLVIDRESFIQHIGDLKDMKEGYGDMDDSRRK